MNLVLQLRNTTYVLRREISTTSWLSASRYQKLKRQPELVEIPKQPQYTRVTTFENVVFPPGGATKLPTMPTEPAYDPELGEKKHKQTRRHIEARGCEPIHTELLHKQYGLMAADGGFIKAADFKYLEECVNRCLKPNQFAIWRVDAPWLPRTKKSQGTRMGGGKGSISHYVTPVRANRIILELGGYVTEAEARAYLEHLYFRFRFKVEFVSEQILERRRALEAEMVARNANPFDWPTVIRWNMGNAKAWLSPYDVIWQAKYK